MRVLRVLTNERRVLRLLTNERQGLPDSLSWLLHLLDTALLPGVVPYPELLGSEATDPLRPSPDLKHKSLCQHFSRSSFPLSREGQ